MSKYRQLDSFTQPREIASKFDSFVRRQAAFGRNPETAAGGTVREVGTWANATRPQVLFQNRQGHVSVDYLSERHVRYINLRFLLSPSGNTQLYTSYTFAPHVSELVLASEMNQTHRRKDGHLPANTPQALAHYLNRPLFERGRMEEMDDASAYSVVGQDEFYALGRLLIGRDL